MAESGLIVTLAEAGPLVDDLRIRHVEAARLGAAPHVTVLYPFVAPEHIDAAVLARLRAALAGFRRFECALSAVGRFEATAYLAPRDPAPFIALTRSLATAFPDHPPFGGVHTDIVPHLTVAHGDADAAAHVADVLAERLAAHGPVRARCGAVELIHNASGRWCVAQRFALEG